MTHSASFIRKLNEFPLGIQFVIISDVAVLLVIHDAKWNRFIYDFVRGQHHKHSQPFIVGCWKKTPPEKFKLYIFQE